MYPLPQEFINTALAAVDKARLITGRYFRTKLEVDSKQDRSPVTVADRETEQAIADIIMQQHPDHGFFGEEGGDQSSAQEWRWIIDPIDGTKSFATGKPTFGTLVALLHEEIPVLGIIDHPALNERWIGIKDQVTTFNGAPCQVSQSETLAESTIYATTLDMFDDRSFDQYSKLSKACKFRAFGGDCYSYGLLASGFTDLVCEADLKPYDYFALVPVVEGAGGIISDWQGKSLALDSGDQVLASANSSLHQAAINQLNF
jgi:histidinol phosphatase-like enzyme (inositol monophosphatase family)